MTRYGWSWRKPPTWLRLLLRRRRAREWRRSESVRRALERPDPDLAAKWANLVAKTRSSMGLPLLDD
jgi:hypothetical protein